MIATSLRTLAAVALAGLALAAAPADGAAPPVLLAQAAFPAAGQAFEFRGYGTGRQGYQDNIWKFSADGRVRGTSSERRGGGQGGYSLELSDTGTWRVTNGQLCIDWANAFRRASGCYAIVRAQGFHVQLNGPQAFTGTLEPS